MSQFTIEKLEEIGEAKVRESLVQGTFGDQKAQIAHRWLEEKDRMANQQSARTMVWCAALSAGAAFTSAIAAIVAVAS